MYNRELHEHQIRTDKLRQALHLIKIHIGAEQTDHNRDLHNAVQLIVDVAREAGILEVR